MALRSRVGRIWVSTGRRLFGTPQRVQDLERTGATTASSVWVVQGQRASTELDDLCDLHGSDKGSATRGPHPFPWEPHTYTELYEFFLAPRRHATRRLLEVGIGTNDPGVPSNMSNSGRPGASLRMWRDYLPNAEIFGADIDERVLFTEDRIRTGRMDQTDPASIRAFFSSVGDIDFDVIIDDGLHKFNANRTLFENAFSRLAPGGIYFIEDCARSTVHALLDYFNGTGHVMRIFSMMSSERSRLGDNSVAVIQRASSANDRFSTPSAGGRR